MSWWLDRACKLLRGETAATMVEYTLLMVFIGLACAVAVTNFGTALRGLFQRAVNGFPP